MIYKEKIIKLPNWVYLGAEVQCDGEGILTVDHIEYKNGKPDRIVLDHGCYEPWAKISNPHTEERVYIAVGHCDVCKEIFTDSHCRHDIHGKNVCDRCYRPIFKERPDLMSNIKAKIEVQAEYLMKMASLGWLKERLISDDHLYKALGVLFALEEPLKILPRAYVRASALLLCVRLLVETETTVFYIDVYAASIKFLVEDSATGIKTSFRADLEEIIERIEENVST